MKKITIHQPEHLVWKGLLDKISKADLFVVLDDVQFEKNYFQNRNRIRYGNSWTWLTVPVKKHSLHTKINEIETSRERNWVKDYLNILRTAYQDSPNFDYLYPKIEEIFNQNFRYLVDLNLALLYLFLKEFKIKTKVVLASTLKIPSSIKGSDRILSICKSFKAKTYLSGQSGIDYLRLSDFLENNIKVEFHSYDTTDNLSAVDHLFYVQLP
jgi:hypothetical protein